MQHTDFNLFTINSGINNMLRQLHCVLIYGVVLLLFIGITGHSSLAQQTEPIGGPYEPDSATILLLHFDQNFDNDNDAQYEVGEANTFGSISFVQLEGAGDLNNQARFINDSPENKSHIQIPDTTALDLTGSWTMEMWVNVFTFGQSREDWRRQPRLYFKPGDPNEAAYWQSNYFFTIFGTLRDFKTGYRNEDLGTQVQIDSPENMLQIGEWFHLTYIRDTTKQVIVQMIHQNAEDVGRLPNENDDELELISFKSLDYGEGLEGSPRTSDQPLFIGTSPQNDTLFANLDGFMDEVRISNVVRNFAVPPIITGVTELDNQQSGQSYEIEANIETLGDAEISTATLHYQVYDGTWQDLTMSEGVDNSYTATIPSQEVGANVTYWIESETNGGLRATNPSTVDDPENPGYYDFAVWTDSVEVFSMDFDEGSGVPSDKSQFETDITFHSSADAPDYAEGDEGGDDMAMVFNAADSTWLETSSAVHQLTNLAVDFKFYAQDSVPPSDTQLLAKGSASSLATSNYRVYFADDGVLWPAMYSPDNDLQPCGSYTGGCLIMDDPEQGTVETETWYRVQIGIRSPEASPDSLGTIFSRFIEIATGDTVGEELHPIDAGAYNNPNSLKIGGVGVPSVAPYYNGLLDDIKVMNYVPNSYLPDSLRSTSIEEPTEMPDQVILSQNYPNPFNPTTNIDFQLPRSSDVELTVYDVLGRRVATLIDGKRSAGSYEISFDASRLSSGVYLYKLETTDVTKTRKMLLIK